MPAAFRSAVVDSAERTERNAGAELGRGVGGISTRRRKVGDEEEANIM